ncbi:MAG: sugar phosphate isomerase/epimerase [Chitinophagaceae bacterium]
MNIGIFAKTFLQPSLEGVLDSVCEYGLNQIQFNMSCAGLSSLPDHIDPVIAQTIQHETHIRNIQIAAVSGTFNMIHPDVAERQLGLNRLRTLARACKDMGTSVITLCTGTRDPDNIWRKHPANSDSSAWKDLLETMEKAIGIAEDYSLTLAFEPEAANVIDTAEKGQKLLNEVRSDHLKVAMDAANLFQIHNVKRMKETMENAFHLLGSDIVIAHAKDIVIDIDDLEFKAAGKGLLDYDTYLTLLEAYNFRGPLILHGLEEQEVETSIHFLKQKLSLIKRETA